MSAPSTRPTPPGPPTPASGAPTPGDGGATVRVRVPAKVNLALCVGPLQPDGYHPLATVFQAISLHDELTARPAAAGHFGIEVTGEGAQFVPADERNLAMKAARLLARDLPGAGVRLRIRKAIPVAGGMAGGSADAAAALLACSRLWGLDLPVERLQELGGQLGSDVPFPLLGGTAIGSGRGERLTPLAGRGTCHWVLAMAHGGLSTPTVFGRFDELGAPGDTSIPDDLMGALDTGDVHALGASLRNDLQAAALDLRPELGATLEAGRRAGALGALVSGSGPTCAFLVPDADAANRLAARLADEPTVRLTRRAHGPVAGARIVDTGA